MATPLESQRPSAHTQRYDRQLRLWASSGQSSLENANILVVGATALSAQILKNLVLPGIGSFTLLDDAVVNGAEMGINFFLQSEESEGKYAAQEMARLLAEMNSNVKANSKIESPSILLEMQPSFFTDFSLIISINQPQSFDVALSDLCYKVNPPSPALPFLKVRSAGMVGELRVSLNELGFVETHPDSVVDLRVTRPFPELETLAEEFDLEISDTMAHSHIPFVVILLKKIREWQAKNGGLIPNSSQRNEFVKLIDQSRQPGNLDQENFDQAIAALGKHVWRPLSSQGVGGGGVPSEIEQMFQDPSCENIHSLSINFWILVRVLKEFVAASPTKSLPLTGSLPDMKATSSIYVKLQGVYRKKAADDLVEFTRLLHEVMVTAAVDGSINDEEIQAFVKHAGCLKLIRGRSERERLDKPNREAAVLAFMDPVNPCTFQHHIALLAADQFYQEERRYPGASRTFSASVTSASAAWTNETRPPAYTSTATRTEGCGDETRRIKRNKSETPTGDGDADMVDESWLQRATTHSILDADREPDLAQDTSRLLLLATDVAAKYGIEQDQDEWDKIDNAVQELVRSGYSSLPPTTALLGGIVAQEAIKLITRQYVPANNTVVYDGIQQAIGVFQV